MIELTKHFSRERSLLYAYLWYKSDSQSILKYFGVPWENTLYLREPENAKISVWYDDQEIKNIFSRIIDDLNSKPEIFGRMLVAWEEQWEKVLPFLNRQKKISDPNSFLFFYENIVSWWSPMNVIYLIPDLEAVSQDIRQVCLDKRLQSERFSDEADAVLLEYLKTKGGDLRDYADVVSPEEVRLYFQDGSIDLAKIKERKSGYALLKGALYSYQDFFLVLNQLGMELKKPEASDLIIGRTAYGGFRKGKVRVVRHREDLGLLQSGEILITEMTTPAYVPYLSKVSAIITDEGGITCHAAIVSRELKIPCVIGTKIATKVLKDGDMVEVDAEKGTVRKIAD